MSGGRLTLRHATAQRGRHAASRMSDRAFGGGRCRRRSRDPRGCRRESDGVVARLRATMTALLAVLDRHLRGLDALVAARLPADPLARAIEVELLVEGRGRGVLDPELVDLVIEGEPLLLVHLLLRGVHEAVEVRVRV